MLLSEKQHNTRDLEGHVLSSGTPSFSQFLNVSKKSVTLTSDLRLKMLDWFQSNKNAAFGKPA